MSPSVVQADQLIASILFKENPDIFGSQTLLGTC